MKKLLLTLLVFLGFNQGNSYAETMPEGTNAFSFSFESIDGSQMDLSQFKGKALLVVNTASLCGFTGQYEGLQSLWEKYKDQGLVVIGVPSNNFKGQEPGSDGEIKEFCETTFGIDFPMTTKVNVTGDDVHPFYVWANSQSGQAPTETNIMRVNDIMSARETANHMIDGYGDRARAFLQIQNGCDHRT